MRVLRSSSEWSIGWCAATNSRTLPIKYAKRLTLIAPEALATTKLAINRGADAADLRNAMQAGIDVVAPLYAAKTEAGNKFRELAQKEGFAAAVRWRRSLFEE